FLLVYNLIAGLAEAYLALPALVISLFQEAVAGTRRAPAARADEHHVRDIQGRLALDDATRLARPARLHVALDDVQSLDHHPVFFWHRRLDLAALPAILAGDDLNLVSSFDVHIQTPI